MLESKIERDACRAVLDELGVASTKLVTPGQRGFPDRIFWIPGGKPLLIEFKRPGEEPRKLQSHIHKMLSMLGYSVEVHDDIDAAVASVRKALDAAKISAHSR